MSPSIATKVVRDFLVGDGKTEVCTSWDMLTDREREVLKLVAEAHTNKKIAELLFISPKTVDKHRTSLMRKLDLHSAAEVTAYAARRGLIS